MDPVFIGLALAATASFWVATMAFLGFTPISGRQRRLEAGLRAMALARRGQLLRRRRLGMPILEVPCALGPFRLEYGSAGSSEDVEPTTLLTVELPRLLPAVSVGAQVVFSDLVGGVRGHEVELDDPVFNRSFRVSGRDEAGIQVLLEPKARQHVRELWERGALESSGLEGLVLEPLEHAGMTVLRARMARLVGTVQDLDACLEGMVTLAGVMLEAWDEPWVQARERFGLVPGTPAQAGLRGLKGEVNGFGLGVWEIGNDRNRYHEVIVDLALPFEIEVVHREVAQKEGWLPTAQPMGNPVLDMLVAVRCEQPSVVRELLADEDLTAALLEVVHGRKGSILTDRHLTLREPGDPAIGPAEAIEDALALARAVRVGVARLQGPA